MPKKIKGTSVSDTMIGTDGNDYFDAVADKDYLDGGLGNDSLDGGSDDDTLFGGDGDDWIDGGSGHDIIEGGEGDDEIIGFSGHDTINAGSGNDSLHAGSGDDIVKHVVGENQGFFDRYDGGSGYDILQICVTDQEAVLYADEIQAIQDFIASGSKAWYHVTLGTSDLTFRWFEGFDLCIDNGGQQFPLPPTANDDANALTEDDAAVAGNVLTNDTDPTNDPLEVINPGVYVGTHGTLTLNADGSYSYAHDVAGDQGLDDGESVQDSFSVQIADDGGLDDDSTLTITINGVNDAPNSHQPNGADAGDDANSLGEDDASVGGNVLTNDTDPESDPLTVANPGVYVGAHGTLTLNGDGTYTYANDVAGNQYLDDGESVQDVFNVTVSDGDLTDGTVLTITINGENDAPNSNPADDVTAGDDVNALGEDDASVGGNVLANDTDPESDPLTVASPGVYVGAHGTLTLNGDGTYTYANDVAGNQYLDDGESVDDVFNVTVSDGSLTDNTQLTITINGENDAPNSNPGNDVTAGDDEQTITEDDPVANGNVLTNDTDPESDPLIVANPGVYVGTHGTLTLNGDGSYSYAHNTAASQALDVGEEASDVFNVVVSDGDLTDNTQLTITITGLNDGPMANDDANALSETDPSVGGNVLTNDTDAEGDALNVTNPGNYNGTYGDLTLNGDGSYTYTPDAGAVAGLSDGDSVQDNFSVDISDGSTGDSSTLTITVNGVNNEPGAQNDSNSLTEDDANVGGNVLTNDVDPEGDALTVSNPGVFAGTHGTLTLNGDGTYDYAINPADFQDMDDGDSVVDSFNFDVTDGTNTVGSQLDITINGLNDAPAAVDDSNDLTEDDSNVGGNVLTNDTDVDSGETLMVGNPGVYAGTHGTLTINSDGSYDYAINPADFQSMDTGDSLQDVFSYDVTDGDATDSGDLTITINGLNDAPTAVDDVAVATVKPGVNTALFGNVLDNDSDPEQAANTLDVISFTKTSATNFGTFNFNADGSWTFFISVLPADGVTVVETWDYVVQDDGGLVDTGQLTFEITGDI